MDCKKTGALIRALRGELGMTQQQLAQRLRVSAQAVSKWECGGGCPDVSLLAELSAVLGVGAQELLSGELDAKDPVGGNMKKLEFYVCPTCGNILTATAPAAVSCCGKTLAPLEAKKADDAQKLSVEKIENDYFISSTHEMTKEHSISFAALLTGDTLLLRRLYPEWNMQTRIPCFGHGRLVWYCTRDGLFYQNI